VFHDVETFWASALLGAAVVPIVHFDGRKEVGHILRAAATIRAASEGAAALLSYAPDSAVVLVFLNQTTTSKENPAGSFTASSVKVGLTKVNGSLAHLGLRPGVMPSVPSRA
jgi:hypothetical protein